MPPKSKKLKTSNQSQEIKISLSLKSDLIKSLTKFSGLLYGEIITDQDRCDLIKSTNRLIIHLSDIVFKSNEGIGLRNELLIHLTINKNRSLVSEYLNSETRKELITENNELLERIMELNTQTDCSIEDNESEIGNATHQTDQVSKETKEISYEIKQLNDIVSRQADKSDKLFEEIGELKRTNDSIQIAIKRLNDQSVELKQCLNEMNMMKSEVTFNWKFELSLFLTSKDPQFSSTFFCRGLKWCIKARKDSVQEKCFKSDYLSLFLNSYDFNELDHTATADNTPSLLAHTDRSLDLTFTSTDRTFTRKSGWGLLEVIRVRELTKPNSVYVQDGFFTVQTKISVIN